MTNKYEEITKTVGLLNRHAIALEKAIEAEDNEGIAIFLRSIAHLTSFATEELEIIEAT